MAKIYEALRRAEQERKRAAGAPAAHVAPFDLERVEPESGASPKKRAGRRWFRRRRKPDAASDATTAINKRRFAILQPDSYIAEQFRALRGRIDSIAAGHPLRSIVVLSALPGEGKTTAAINLAAMTALSLEGRVLLVDCDLRRPKVHQALGLRLEAGLTEVLTRQAGLDRAIVKVEGANFEVLGVRAKPTNPSELLGSSAMRDLIEELSRRYDRIVLDSPAVLGLPDAKAISEICDGLIMVVRADVTAERDVEAALEILDRRRILGLLLNGATIDQKRHGYTP